MDVIPSLFLQNGKAVSLYKGRDGEQKKVYPKAPKNYVKAFAEQGAQKLFIVDFDANQQEHLPEFRAIFPGEIWWAGQVRDLPTLRKLFANGADRVVLGRSAEPIYQEALEEFGPRKLIVGIQVMLQEKITERLEELSNYSFETLLVKDLNAEGTLFQPSFDLMEKAVYFSEKEVYASGGISSDQDLPLLAQAGVKGVLIVRALYENQLSLADLLVRYQNA